MTLDEGQGNSEIGHSAISGCWDTRCKRTRQMIVINRLNIAQINAAIFIPEVNAFFAVVKSAMPSSDDKRSASATAAPNVSFAALAILFGVPSGMDISIWVR